MKKGVNDKIAFRYEANRHEDMGKQMHPHLARVISENDSLVPVNIGSEPKKEKLIYRAMKSFKRTNKKHGYEGGDSTNSTPRNLSIASESPRVDGTPFLQNFNNQLNSGIQKIKSISPQKGSEPNSMKLDSLLPHASKVGERTDIASQKKCRTCKRIVRKLQFLSFKSGMQILERKGENAFEVMTEYKWMSFCGITSFFAICLLMICFVISSS